MLNVVIAGCTGRMGRNLIKAILKDDDINLLGGLASPSSKLINQPLSKIVLGAPEEITICAQASHLSENCSVLIDFTHPEVTMSTLDWCIKKNKSMVVCTTGFTESQLKKIKAAGQKIPILIAPNTSIGINLSYELIELISGTLSPETEVHIHEIHHRYKKDSPSGTALKMGEIVSSSRNFNQHLSAPQKDAAKPLQFTSVRADEIVGEHTISFYLEGEKIELTHRATSRKIFALGALKAAKWLAKQPIGCYSMKEVLFD